jgi:CRISPR system Cascade subunit CasD
MDAMILRFDAPMLSFGDTCIDNRGVISEFPGRSLVAGLIANALGYEHREFEKTQRLQDRIRLAARCDRSGSRIVDYQTVDLGQPELERGWTTRGVAEGRKGSVSTQTHIRYRYYHADSVYTLAINFISAEEEPTLLEAGFALREPERPIFLGRKACVPAAPVFLGLETGDSLYEILKSVPSLPAHRRPQQTMRARWSMAESWRDSSSRPCWVADVRDWRNGIHTGRYAYEEGTIECDPFMDLPKVNEL